MVTASKSPEQLAKERLARMEAAINLEEPDRVPIWGFGGEVVAKNAGVTQYDLCYDFEKTLMANEKFAQSFPFDILGFGISGLDGRIFCMAFAEDEELSPAVGFISGPLHDILGDRYTRFPGRETDVNTPPQFVGGTFMEPDEYDQLIEDPVKFIAETVLPRVCKNLETPRQAMATWIKVGMEMQRSAAENAKIGEISAKYGFPALPMGGAYAPLDIIGDFLRGISNVVLDIRRYPDKVKKATEALLKPVLDYSLTSAKMGAKYSFIPLHLNEYLSPKLYKEFYWPTLKEVILELYNHGIKTFVFFEGHHEQHLETILELPRGWGVAYFEKTDIVKAKEVLKDHTCVMGGLPVSLVASGTPETIDEYIKNLLEKVKPGGGFILTTGVGSLPAETPLENITAVIEAVEKYGKY